MKIIRFAKAFFTVTAVLALFSCSTKKRTPPPADLINIEVAPHLNSAEVNHCFGNEGGIICLVFGEGFSGADFYDSLTKKLIAFYGNEADGGKVMILNYPSDFNGRISQLYEIIGEKDVSGILLLGAPTNTHRALARIEDFWDQEKPFNIISLFPHDDPDGEESTCNIVISSESTDLPENIECMILSATDYLNKLPGVLDYSTELFTHAENIIGKGTLERFTDSKTGLHSINHFVIKASENAQ